MSVIFRLIAPIWGRRTVNGLPNPEFREEIAGPPTLEGEFDKKFIQQKNKEGYNVYFFPNFPSPYSSGPGTWINGKDVNVFCRSYVDMDLKDGVYASKEAFIQKLHENPKLLPSKIIDSGNGIHAYWEISDLTRESFMELQFRLIQHFKTDESVWTAHHIMRFPGTLNTKNYDKRVDCTTVEKNPIIYRFDALSEELPDIFPEHKQKIAQHLDKLFGEPKALLNDDGELPAKFVKLMEDDLWIRTLFESPREFAGDRSKADMSLCNVLYNKQFTREEAYNVLLHTQKALSRSGRDRGNYAQTLIDKVYSDRPLAVAYSVEELSNMEVVGLGDRVFGPGFFDATESGWRQREVLGLIAPPGTGKTSICLKIVRDCIANSPKDDSVFIYFSLEMTLGEIVGRWHTLTNNNKEFDKRLYIVSNEVNNGDLLYLNLQDIYRYTFDTANKLGKKVAGIVIDHINIINPVIDIRHQPSLGVVNPSGNIHNYQVKLELPDICRKLKELSKLLNCFLIIQSQTTKGKAGNGDQVLDMNAAFGTASFEWFCDYIMTFWQPLRPLYDEITLRAVGWKYEKIRNSSDKDRVRVGVRQLLTFDTRTRDMRPMSEPEYQHALEKLKEIRDRKKKENNGEYTQEYKNSTDAARLRLIYNESDDQNRSK